MLRQTLALLFAGLALGGCAAAPPPRVVYVEAHSYPPPAPAPRVVHVEHHHHDVGRAPRYVVPPRAVPPPRARGPRAHGGHRPHAAPPPRRPHAAPPPRLGTRPVPPDKAHPNAQHPRKRMAHKPKHTRDRRATAHQHKPPHADREKDSAKR